MLNQNKKSGAGALFYNKRGEILIVKPTYKEGWLFPGGIIESNETPSEACKREIGEELGLTKNVEELLCIDYGKQDNESVTYMFYGGILSDEEIASITLPQEELSEYRLVSSEEAIMILRPKSAKRLPFCLGALKENKVAYLENGQVLA